MNIPSMKKSLRRIARFTNKRTDSGPDLHVLTLKFLDQKNCFFHVFVVNKKFRKNFHEKGIMQLFSAKAIVFSKKFQKIF